MALELKGKLQITSDTATLVVTDITGEYNASTNTTGWGAPNQELSESAVIAVARRKLGTDYTYLEAATNQFVYDPAALNSKQTTFHFTMGLDGHIQVYLFRLPVSLDGANTVEGDALIDGDIFYWNNGDVIWEMVDGTPEAIEPEELIGNNDIIFKLCEKLLFPDLAVKYNLRYKDYTDSRATSCDDSQKLFEEILRFRLDLAGAKYSFDTGEITKAEDIIQSLLRRYNLIS